MEDIREAASAYYHNLPDNLKDQATAKFNEIDSNGSGRISMKEFKASMGSTFDNHSGILKRSFKELDNNGDGTLDFDEYITLYYLVESGRAMVYCSGTGKGCETAPFLKGLYFTCVDCFHDNKIESYDLCASCYRNKHFDHHEHDNFVDNYVLLLTKAAWCASSSELSSCGSADSDSDQVSPSGSKKGPVTSSKKGKASPSGSNRRVVSRALGAVRSGVSVVKTVGGVASDVATACSIM